MGVGINLEPTILSFQPLFPNKPILSFQPLFPNKSNCYMINHDRKNFSIELGISTRKYIDLPFALIISVQESGNLKSR